MASIKKLKKIIVIPAALATIASCTIIMVNAFSADKPSPKTPAASLPDKTGTDDMSYIVNDGILTGQNDNQKNDVQDVRALVEAFGKNLKMVSLIAPKDVAAKSIEEYYKDYVTPELLQKWKDDPQSTPGRMVSSPWPERIDILGMETGEKDQYTVYGEIIEVTSVELAKGGAAAKRPVTIVVQKINGHYLISSVTMGEYGKIGPVVYENAIYGFRFYLPETWKGYSIVEEKWEGLSNGELVETGLRLLIRHPDWTDDNPRQDIPIMVFTLKQWDALCKEEFSVGAAPIGPSKLGSNSAYVFALPARYNFAFQTGFEEVEEILKTNPLWPLKPSEKSSSLQDNQKGTEITFNNKVESHVNSVMIKPEQIIEAGPELMEQVKQEKDESIKPASGIFDTTLCTIPEGDAVKLDFSLHNISGQPIEFYFSSSQKYDIFIRNQNDEEVYRWSHDKGFLTAIVNTDLKKDEKLTSDEAWDYKDNNGKRVPPGKYSVTVKWLAKFENGKDVNRDELTAVRGIEVY